MRIKEVLVRKVLNSRREETVGVVIKTDKGTVGASAPSGASRGKHEVNEYSVHGINGSIALLNKISKNILKLNLDSFEDLEKVEAIARNYDKTNNLSVIGGNALYALEASLVKAMAFDRKLEPWQFLSKTEKQTKPIMPRLIGNAIGGGKHTNGKKTDFQEFLFIPRTRKFAEAHIMNLEAYRKAKEILMKKDKAWMNKPIDKKINYENAMTSTLSNTDVLEIMLQVKKLVGVEIGIDCAASSFFNAGKYVYENFSSKKKKIILSTEEQIKFILNLVNKNGIFYMEDPLQENDFSGFNELRKKIKTKCLVCGDDLICTNLSRLNTAINNNSVNAIIIKPNQVGSLLDAKKTALFAKKHGITTIVSHRSGETLDNFIAHLAVGWQMPFIKTGIIGSERQAKLHELVRIERDFS